MEFLKSVLAGVTLIFLLFILSGINRQSDTATALGQAFMLIFVAPIILIISVAIGIKQQTSQPRIESNIQSKADKQRIKAKNKIYFMILFILAIIFLSILFISIYFIPHPHETNLNFSL